MPRGTGGRCNAPRPVALLPHWTRAGTGQAGQASLSDGIPGSWLREEKRGQRGGKPHCVKSAKEPARCLVSCDTGQLCSENSDHDAALPAAAPQRKPTASSALPCSAEPETHSCHLPRCHLELSLLSRLTREEAPPALRQETGEATSAGLAATRA